jgi:hypothetical protein
MACTPEPGAICYFMATHKFLTNSEGGYFYRFYPKLSMPAWFTTENPVQADMFNPFTDIKNPQVENTLFGKFSTKYEEKGKYKIILYTHALITFKDLHTPFEESRELRSKLIIDAPAALYKYDFIPNRIYKLTVNTITDITP